MGKISNLYKFRKDGVEMAKMDLDYLINNGFIDNPICRYMSRSEFFFLFFRYLFALMVIVFLVTILFPDLTDDVLYLPLSSVRLLFFARRTDVFLVGFIFTLSDTYQYF